MAVKQAGWNTDITNVTSHRTLHILALAAVMAATTAACTAGPRVSAPSGAAAATPSVSTSTTAPTATLSGKILFVGAAEQFSGNEGGPLPMIKPIMSLDGDTCEGLEGYDYLASGAPLQVLDLNDQIVAAIPLPEGSADLRGKALDASGSGVATCTFDFAVPGLSPEGSYRVKLGNGGDPSNSGLSRDLGGRTERIKDLTSPMKIFVTGPVSLY